MAGSQSETESDLGRSSVSDLEAEGLGAAVHGKKAKRVNKSRWTKEEDDKLKSIVELEGTEDWKLISDYFDDRSDHQCLHRWQKVLNPELVKGAWTREEDDKVVELVRRYGPKRWSTIAQHLPGRIGKQCRERWHNHLNPVIKKTAWTEEEDQIIYNAHLKIGNKWAEIAKMVPGRTDNAIKNHWNSTMKKRVEAQGYQEYKENRYRSGKYYYKEFRQKERRRGNVPQFQPIVDDCLESSSLSVFQSAPTMARDPMKASVNTRASAQENTSASGDQQSSAPQAENTNPDMLSPLRTIPDDLKELFELDTNAWGDLPSFDSDSSLDLTGKSPATNRWISPGMTGCRFDGNTIASIQASAKGPLIPITSPLVTNRFRTPPAILRKGKKRRRDDRNISTLSSSISSLCTPSGKTPQSTPIKSLPFSPSQFFNSPISARDIPGIITSTPVSCRPTLTSTPVLSHDTLNTPKVVTAEHSFRTPGIRRSLLNSPRTPTPFKEAMATFQTSSLSITNHMEQDITEIIERGEAEAVQDIIPSLTDDSLDEVFPTSLQNLSGTFVTTCQPIVSSTVGGNVVTPMSQLHVEEIDSCAIDTSYISPLSSSAVKPDDVFGAGEQYVTPNKTLHPRNFNDGFNLSSFTAAGIDCSPEQAILQHIITTPQNIFYNETPTANRNLLYQSFQEVACGLTADQKFLTEQARQFVYRQTARSLKFVPYSCEA